MEVTHPDFNYGDTESRQTCQTIYQGWNYPCSWILQPVPALFPFCFARWNRFLKDALHFRFNLEENYRANKPMVVSCDNESIFITFYPDRAASLIVGKTLKNFGPL